MGVGVGTKRERREGGGGHKEREKRERHFTDNLHQCCNDSLPSHVHLISRIQCFLDKTGFVPIVQLEISEEEVCIQGRQGVC